MKDSKIEWTDHTFNAWEGCTKVSPGCANCYAESRNERFHGGVNWGPGTPRRIRSDAYWKQPLKWNIDGYEFASCKCGWTGSSPFASSRCGGCLASDGLHYRRPRVFCSSLADWLDEEGPINQLARLLKLIHDTPNLDWLLLSKRPRNWIDRITAAKEHYDGSWILDQWLQGHPPRNVWIGTTVEDQQRADERIPELLRIPARVRFLSCEPLLGSINLERIVIKPSDAPARGKPDVSFTALSGWNGGANRPDKTKIDWVICGGESGPNARPMHPDWARSLRDQCQAAGVPFFFKQWGEWGPVTYHACRGCDHPTLPTFQDDSFKVHALTPEQFMEGPMLGRIGKKAAGRRLDSREWNEFPNP